MALYQTLTLAAFGLYFLMVIGVSLLADRSTKHEGFIIGQRRVGIWGTAMSMGAGFRDVAFSSIWIFMGYQFGYGAALAILGGFCLGGVIMAQFAPHLRRMAEKHDIVTPGEMVHHLVGPCSAWALKIFLMIMPVIFSAAQVYVLASVLHLVTGWPMEIVVVANLVLIGFYLFLGGYANIIRTDLLQMVVVSALMLAIFFLPWPLHFPPLDSSTLLQPDITTLIAFFVSSLALPFNLPDFYQRVFSTKDDQTAKKGTYLGYVVIVILSSILVILGLSLRLVSGDLAGESNMFISVFKQLFEHPYLFAMFMLIFLSFAMSTIDTQAYLATGQIAQDIFKVQQGDRDHYIRTVRWLLMAFLIGIGFLSFHVGSLIGFLLGLVSVYAVISAMFVVALLREKPLPPKEDRGMMIAALAGGALFLYLLIKGYYERDYAYIIAPMGVTWVLSAWALRRYWGRGFWRRLREG